MNIEEIGSGSILAMYSGPRIMIQYSLRLSTSQTLFTVLLSFKFTNLKCDFTRYHDFMNN